MAFMDGHNGHLVLAFGILGNVISFLVYLAPLPTFYRIRKRKSTEGFQSLPYLVALFSSMLWLYYALVKKNAALLVTINSLGCVIESIYIVTYIFYATREARILTIKLFMAMNVCSFIMILLTTKFALHASVRVTVLGWICVSFAGMVFAAPLTIVAQVIKTKSVEFMPFNLSFFLTLSAIVWFCYGLFLKDICIAIPNVLGFTLGILQMLLYAFYSNGEGKKKEVIKEEHALEAMMINVLVMNPLGTACEVVYPIHVNEQGKECAEYPIHVNELQVKECAEENKEKGMEEGSA